VTGIRRDTFLAAAAASGCRDRQSTSRASRLYCKQSATSDLRGTHAECLSSLASQSSRRPAQRVNRSTNASSRHVDYKRGDHGGGRAAAGRVARLAGHFRSSGGCKDAKVCVVRLAVYMRSTCPGDTYQIERNDIMIVSRTTVSLTHLLALILSAVISLCSLQLALVHMADHYTRVRCGGSPLDADSPIVGVLYGETIKDQDTSDKETARLVIHHALETSDLTDLQRPLQLHQAVFPTHHLVGWYRVVGPASSDCTITEADWQQTLAVCDQFNQARTFALLQVPSQGSDLPLSFFQLDPSIEDGPMIACETWSFDTRPAEQIALERVTSQPRALPVTNDLATSSPYLHQVAVWQESVQTLLSKVQIIQAHLQETNQLALLRDLDSLTIMLDIMNVSSQDLQVGSLPWATSLAILAQTVDATQQSLEEWKQAQEPSIARGRRMMDPNKIV
jgi:hypothetical protein